MARQRKDPAAIKLRQPDRSAPTEQTLLDLAQERNLFEQARQREEEKKKQKQKQQRNDSTKSNPGNDTSNASSGSEDDEGEEAAVLSPGAERFLESVLWTSTLAMLHFTLDVLVQNQYGVVVKWDVITWRTAIAWPVFFFLFHPLHPNAASPPLIPSLISPARQHPFRQTIFFLMSTISGCGLIHTTNSEGYLAVMKRAPPMACLWVWAVVELDLPWAALSLSLAGGFLWGNGYSVL